MYRIIKCLEISAAHALKLDYKSKCENLHGHNWHVKVFCQAPELDENGMVIDFCRIKEIGDELDHKNLNDVFAFPTGAMNPTAECIAAYIASRIGEKCYRVEVQESDGNIAFWCRDEN